MKALIGHFICYLEATQRVRLFVPPQSTINFHGNPLALASTTMVMLGSPSKLNVFFLRTRSGNLFITFRDNPLTDRHRHASENITGTFLTEVIMVNIYLSLAISSKFCDSEVDFSKSLKVKGQGVQ